jgi:LacI family transcriptional regulator
MPPGEPDRISEGRVYDWLYADAVRSVQQVLAPTAFGLELGMARTVPEAERVIQKSRCDGVICGMGSFEKLPDVLQQNQLPYICCSQGDFQEKVNACMVDEIGGGAVAATALIDHGRNRLAHISGVLATNRICADRWCGFRKRVRQQGLSEPELIDGKLGVAGGYTSGKLLAERIRAGGVDGVFVVNDITAVGVMQAFSESGIKVPEHVSVIGYDNLPLVRTLPVPLATVDISIGQVYRTATQALLANLRTPQPVRQKITPTLVPGASLG